MKDDAGLDQGTGIGYGEKWMDLRGTPGNGINGTWQFNRNGERGRGQGMTSRTLAWIIRWMLVLYNEKITKEQKQV